MLQDTCSFYEQGNVRHKNYDSTKRNIAKTEADSRGDN